MGVGRARCDVNRHRAAIRVDWCRPPILRHSREGGNPDALPSRFDQQRQRFWIPACAGMTECVGYSSPHPTPPPPSRCAKPRTPLGSDI
ncbi:hypothetical protein DC429_15570 [Arthrobacter sp. TPD3018]|nr:hypothetical protein DC425_14945 [Sphingomonas sp. TPD3009]PVE52933.1 hypothetical protein DC429_15570 [Arthrobacter sp. TPD3018]PVE81318.1 hypothetical protein DC431_14955 [Sphingomonas melonis]